jgi:hypothetical protein
VCVGTKEVRLRVQKVIDGKVKASSIRRRRTFFQ